MTADAALAGAAPGSASPAIRDREPPAWLRGAQKLTPARARELLADLESPCPGADADAQRRHSDAQAKKLALLVFGLGAANAPAEKQTTPKRQSPAASPRQGLSKTEEEDSDAFAAAVAACASHPDRDVRILAVDALVAIAERDPKAAAPHVGALIGLLRDPEDASLALAALRSETFPARCRAAAAAAATRKVPSSCSAHAFDAFDVLAAALAARGPDAFARNASALQLVDALGPEVAWRHADAVAAFVAADESRDVRVSGKRKRLPVLDEKANDDDDDDEEEALKVANANEEAVPAHGSALCELALRALRRSPEASTKFVADARRWTVARGVPESLRNAATGLVRFADSRNAEIRREMDDMRLRRVSASARVLTNGGDGKFSSQPADKASTAFRKNSPSPVTVPPSNERRAFFYDVRPDAA
jgi:hypothetical protein